MSKLNMLLLISIFFLQIVSSGNNNDKSFYLDWQRLLLELNCSFNNGVFCPMIPAIADIFNQIQQEEIEANSNNICIELCLTYSNIHVRDMLCENLDIKHENNIGEIIFGNCSVLISGEIGYENRDYKNINFGTFLSELYIPSMTFFRKEKVDNMEFKYENASVKFNFDNTRAIFKSMSENLTEHMEEILNMVYDDFIRKIEDKLNPTLSRDGILADTKKKMYESFTFFENGPHLFDEKKNVTYLSYNKIDHTEMIILREKIFFFTLQVDFQYALNNNITYNEGFFMLRNVVFEANEGISNIYYQENIKEMTKQAGFEKLNIDNKNKIELWELIINDFKKKFNDYKVTNDNNVKKTKFFY